ncbi:GC-rich sequence DNA-binding factor-like protein-domain-containing protein [Cantharellus anzutake]|uniref:GC-rich sequence DNA-binding factor-like protein-domain-containing protein n=1 Tax=Cantharellus anzutake TaxID=1750568 RepID=UPI0019082FFE|nr:GC-rich sequence DNA-binding factor-like protein-domain-containing protein [Cantharellus anzutake]KAF8343173.1 GC-rich sequence DNA-binding factor-like protein-domain-containing protein [Cantharellus anzutake]
MGRRKRNLMEDDNSSGSSENDEGRGVSDRGDPDARDEQELFADPYRRAKRYRKGGKEDSILGIFARSEDEEDNLPSRLSGGRKPKYTKPVSFVSGSTGPAEAVDPDEVQSDHEPANNLGTSDESEGDVNMEDGEDGDEEPEEPEESERPGLGLSSFSASHFSSPIVTSSAAPHGDGSADSIPRTNRAGIGARDGLGSSSATKKGLSSASASFAGTLSAGDTSLPTSFGSPNTASASFANRARTSFVRDSANAAMSPKTAAQLTAEDQRHLQKLSGSFGAKMMEKMGWTPGEGIGLSNVGIATPIEVKLRPKSAGLAFQGFRERTDQSIREARRRGEAVSDEEIDTGGSKGKGKSKGRGGEKDRSNAWKKPKKTITRIKHMTYEEIIAESDETVPTSSLGVIIDATGATPREISSIADVSSASWIPSVEAERIPEVRHNLRILWSSAKSEFEGLVKEAKALEERKKWLKDEETRLRKVMVAEDIALSRLREISQIVERINLKSQGIASYEANLDVLAEEFDKLAIDYSPDYDKYELDEVVVGAIAPYVKRYTSQWKPLEAPSVLADDFRRWRKLFRMSHSKCDHAPLSSVGYLSPARASSKNGNASMTHYESLLWNVWLPRLRSTINNDWNVSNPSPLIRVLEAWSDLLPPFMLDNILDQLVLPKVQKALSDWSWTGEVALQSLVLPWLPHIGLRMEFLLDDTRRKLRSFLKSWKVEQGVPSDFVVWKEVLKAREWEDSLLKYIVPKLGAHLREKFTVNPAQQDMEPLLRISAWITILRPATFSQLLEMEFFPKWLSVLHMWLTQPGSDYNEVNEWYRFWKGSFSQEVLDLPRVSEGFARGLQLMNQATGLSPQARASLPKPDISNLSAKLPAEKTIPLKENRPVPEEVTFRSIVEEFVAEHNLFFVPMGKAHPKARLPLYRISQSVDGRGGVPVYISDDVVWALPVGGSDDDTYEPVMLDELVLRASSSRK